MKWIVAPIRRPPVPPHNPRALARRITLAVADASAPRRTPAAHSFRSLTIWHEQGGRARLLIVDDYAAMRRLPGRLVEDLFSSVEECEDGADALAAYERHRPDWVFRDIEMSRTDGITAKQDLGVIPA